ncbi:Diguanylate cyclase, GGDEF domain [Marinitoga hydrogenitolerans DSM 16785]|uniref:Diguanylate cyclase, GGDEF domain n=1 Tax=Marinitoga hydrogenitolerans (strain DSM 16785 / JCM 12826 / AT1271) TaxID=1122195 RepID=A0A1M4VGH3_MARH1|nr:diguanylate cyclase [Marinitoga hydrogenitolerans]SHE68038.1 Diguanylate cyclase, GGDEF domain [Marinitoga hydrogenitolerans DSM 16785]
MNKNYEKKVNELEIENDKLRKEIKDIKEELENINNLLEEYNNFSKEEIDAYSDFVEGFVERKFIDPSTRVYSREFFDKIFFLLLETAFEKNNNYGLIIVKIPELENLNYKGEYYKGPEMEIGRILRNNVRLPLDLVMRYSKTVFSIIIPDIDEEVLFKVTDRIKYQLKNFTKSPETLEFYSFYLPKDLTSTEEILKYFD